jgi:hypothetical protein
VKGTRYRNGREFEDSELQRAIQLSLQEVGAATGYRRPGYVPSYEQPHQVSWSVSEPPLVDRSTHPARTADEENDPDLKAAIEASLREAHAPQPSAPMPMETPRTEYSSYAYGEPQQHYSQSYPPTAHAPIPAIPALPNHDLEPLESDAILTFNQMVEQVQAQNRPDMARYPAVNELYQKAANLTPKLTMSVDDTGRKERKRLVFFHSCRILIVTGRTVGGDAWQALASSEALRPTPYTASSATEVAATTCAGIVVVSAAAHDWLCVVRPMVNPARCLPTTGASSAYQLILRSTAAESRNGAAGYRLRTTADGSADDVRPRVCCIIRANGTVDSGTCVLRTSPCFYTSTVLCSCSSSPSVSSFFYLRSTANSSAGQCVPCRNSASAGTCSGSVSAADAGLLAVRTSSAAPLVSDSPVCTSCTRIWFLAA